MPAPETADAFLTLVRKSGVLEADRLDAYLKQQTAAGQLPDEPVRLARAMIRAGLLTRFQAEQCLMGKWRRFTVGNYRVLERLGSGGMGHVYLCEHQVMHHRVAVKILTVTDADDTVILKRFEREGRAGAMLEHPNIVRAHDIGREGNLYYLVMDYVYGSSLHELVQQFGAFDVTRACHYVSQAARGLHYAHRRGVIHRDVKPANLLLDRNGVIKVLDLGMARFDCDEEKLTSGILGTADYLAPEQARNSHQIDARADVYSLGASFYYLLAGKPPFHDAKSIGHKLIALDQRPPRPVRELRPEVPAEIDSLVQRMLAKEPAARPADLAAVIQELSPWTQVPIPPPSERELPRLSLAVVNSSTTEFELSLAAASEPFFAETAAQAPSAPAIDVPAPVPWKAVALTALLTSTALVALWWLLTRPAA